MSLFKLSNVRKIAVLRANALGDFIFTLPALDALRKAYPDAEIVLLGLDWHAEFLEGRPGPVDRVVVVPNGWMEDGPGSEEGTWEMERFYEAMAREHFDLALQLYGGGRHSNPFVRHLGARTTAGLQTPDAEALDRVVPYIYFQHEILRCLEVVSLVGAEMTWPEPRLAVTERDLAEAYAGVPESSRPLAVLHPGVGDGRRQWPAVKFAEVGNALREAGALVVVIGTEPEQPLIEAVMDGMGGQAQDLCGRISLGGLAGLLSRTSVVVSNDSGPLHMGAAVGAATVGIYWCGNMINAAPITRARHRPLVSWRLDCSICGRNCVYDNCEHHDSFVADIPVEDVTAAALDLLGSARPQRGAAAQDHVEMQPVSDIPAVLTG